MMYTYRMWQQRDLPWLEQVAALAAWEGLSQEERAVAAPATVAEAARHQVRSTVQSGWGTAIVAEAAGQPAGVILAAVGPDGTTEEMNGHLLTVWVAPQHRRRGVARNLQAAAEGLLARTGLRKVKIWTGLHNQAAVNLAKQAGFKPEGLIGMKAL